MILLWKQPKLGYGKGGINGLLERSGEMEVNMYNMFAAIGSESESLDWKVWQDESK